MTNSVCLSCMIILVLCSVALGNDHGVETRAVSLAAKVKVYDLGQADAKVGTFALGRTRRQAGPFPSNFRGENEDKPYIPRIEPPPPGSILTYNGQVIPANGGAFSIVPKSERKTPGLARNRPQYATYRGDLPPAIPDVIPQDLPQFKNLKHITSNIPSGFPEN